MKNIINIDFKSYTSIKIGNILPVEVLHTPISQEDRYIIGHGFNTLVSPQAKHLAILGHAFNNIEPLPNGMIKVGAALNSYALFKYAKKNNLKGFEMLSHLPGSVGGLVAMNAGMSLHKQGVIMRYEISDILEGVISSSGFIHSSLLQLDYRTCHIDDIIYYAIFKANKGFRAELVHAFQKIRRKQPNGASFGSAFKNPPKDFAGRLIESVGLKGKSMGNVCFSEQHANFLINKGNAHFHEAINLLEEAKRRVFDSFGIMLEEEVVIIQ